MFILYTHITPILSNSYDKFDDQVTIALVGKYTVLKDSYISVFKALKHAAFACGRQANICVSKLYIRFTKSNIVILLPRFYTAFYVVVH